LTTYLHERGHHSLVAADPTGLLYSRLQQAGLPVLPFRVRNHLDIVAGLRLRRYLRTQSYHLVHFHTARAHALSPWLSGLNVKRLVTRRMDYPVQPGLTTRLLYVSTVDKVIAISQGVQAALQAGGVPATQLRLIHSGIDTSRFTPDPRKRDQVRAHYHIAPATPVIVSVGALVNRKGHDLLVTAASQLKAQGYALRYLISGEGPLRSTLEAQVHDRGLTEEITFTGFCSDIPSLLSAADLFVHTPHHEGLGVAVIEALAAHLPILASHVGGIPELIDDERTGLLISPQDASALATTLARLLDHPQLARQLGAAGQTAARQRFDVKVMAQANESLYLELCADSS
jgi:glycosyltransferase involved in cell wall biosynthesis